jgi:tRNA (guanine-N7-)-methyltransferase
MRVRNVKNKDEILKNSSYVILNPEEYLGKWRDVFNNSNPIYLEIGMGKGNFIIENAKTYPNINFIGLEKNGSVLTYAVKKLEGIDLPNLKLICFDASNIDLLFFKEIDKLYLNFSDPWPKDRHAKRRLTSPIFLDKYEKLFRVNNIIEMKTDNKDLFEYSLETMKNKGYNEEDISYNLTERDDFPNIKTEYEEKFILKNNPIYFVRMLKRVNF